MPNSVNPGSTFPEQIFVLDDFHVKVDKQRVFDFLHCGRDSSAYEEMEETFAELEPEILQLAEPRAVLAFSHIRAEQATAKLPEGTGVIYLISTIGAGLSDLSGRWFAKDEYVRGMLADAMADHALFSMEDELISFIRKKCDDLGIGVNARLEAPQDIPMSWQKTALEETRGAEKLGLGITKGFMLVPLKSNCQIFILTPDTEQMKTAHDCRNCPRIDCMLRHIPDVQVTVQGTPDRVIVCDSGESILSLLTKNGYYISAACGGRGACGKCGVQFVKNAPPITEPDRRLLSVQDLAAGWRLSCTAYPKKDCTLRLPENHEQDFEVLGTEKKQERPAAGNAPDTWDPAEPFDLAVDIGTTTLAVSLVDRTGKAVDTWTGVNHQRAYGADVISRIKASNEGKKEELRESIRGDLKAGFAELIGRNHADPGKAGRIAIAGNTTMGHLLMGFSCEGLGVVPFTPVDIRFQHRTFAEVFGASGDGLPGKAEVILLPGITTYVGADIAAGIYTENMQERTEISLLVDLGTNGEMAVGNRDRILVTSTAAGPAFEGGNISCGMGSVKGAICAVRLNGAKQAAVRTIGDASPVGICGTGVIETAAELVRTEIVDETGRMDDEFFDEGFPLAQTADGREILFTQQDVREIQLAKSAVRAGMETLLACFGVSCKDVAHVFLAGGFGFRLDKEKAIAIGMLPEELQDRIEAVGNSSLSGAIQYLSDARGEETLSRIASEAEEVSLAADPRFNDFYMEYMMFGEEE